MFRKIFTALTSESTMDRAFADLGEMLDHGLWMFQRANEVLHSTVPAEEVHDAIYARDEKINDLERSIRRKVLRYLTVNPGYDVAVCLALMSVAKDAERIGDYCKNLFEVGCVYNEGFHVAKYHEPLDQISLHTCDMFALVRRAISRSDEGQARRALDMAREIRHSCDEIIAELFRDENQMQLHEAVAYSLLARHYKRVAGHLANIATAALGNLEDMDFYPADD